MVVGVANKPQHKLKSIKRYREASKLTQKKVPKGIDDQDISPIHAAHKDKDDQKGIVHLEDKDDDKKENNPYNLLTKQQLNVPKSLRSAIKKCKYCSQRHNDAWDEATINKLLAKRSKKDTFLLSKAIIAYKQKSFSTRSVIKLNFKIRQHNMKKKQKSYSNKKRKQLSIQGYVNAIRKGR